MALSRNVRPYIEAIERYKEFHVAVEMSLCLQGGQLSDKGRGRFGTDNNTCLITFFAVHILDQLGPKLKSVSILYSF